MKSFTRFSIKGLLWLTALSGVALSWAIDHISASRRLEAEHLKLMSLSAREQLGEQSTNFFRTEREALEAVLRHERKLHGRASDDSLVWSGSAGPLAFEIDIPLADENGIIWFNAARADTNNDHPPLKPAFNRLGAVLVHAKGFVVRGTDLIDIVDSPEKGRSGGLASIVRIPGSSGRVRMTLPEGMRGLLELNGPGQHHIAIYGAWRSIAPSAVHADEANAKRQFFAVRPLVIAP